MNTKTKQAIQEHALDQFLGDDVNLDTRGMTLRGEDLALIDMRDPFTPDPKFAPVDQRSRGFGSVALKNFISDSEDSEVAATLRANGIEDPLRSRTFNTTGWTGTMRYHMGAWHFSVESDEGEEKQFKIATKDAESAQVSAARYLSKNNVIIRELSEDERLYCARLAGMGKRDEAVMNYLAYSIPDFDGTDVSTDPRYQKVCNDCAWFVFVHGTPQYQDSDEAREFISAYVGDRPTTVELLHFGFRAYIEREKSEERRLPEDQSEAPTYENLDELGTEEIARLREETLRLRAKTVRGGLLV